MEIERKFLVHNPPGELASYPSTQVRQGYLAIGPDGVEVRVRRYGDVATLTVKSPGGLVRVEEEIEIDEDRFGRLWPLTEGRRIDKRRHRVPLADLTVEVDVYGDALAGLMVAEVEFPSEVEARAFEPPDWFGAEVTTDARYRNQALATLGPPEP